MTWWKFDFVGVCYAFSNQTDSSSRLFSQISFATPRLKPNFGRALARLSDNKGSLGTHFDSLERQPRAGWHRGPRILVHQVDRMFASGGAESTDLFCRCRGLALVGWSRHTPLKRWAIFEMSLARQNARSMSCATRDLGRCVVFVPPAWTGRGAETLVAWIPQISVLSGLSNRTACR